eukprot:TRINITY_DN128390_c0_g1_i1.p1 TRINITY_DN128390_c0_g1~~TRINITY_DN128390_c0_g1_i1.p1  ORF type:complete len:178 (-),score=19.74 TRINITY_DN128390_c0_g1_i1:77-544(-)
MQQLMSHPLISKRMKEAYDALDVGKKGYLNKFDILNGYAKVGHEEPNLIKKAMGEYGKEENENINREEFFANFIAGSRLGVLGLFLTLDQDKDGKLKWNEFRGYIEMQRVLTEKKMSEEEAMEIFNETKKTEEGCKFDDFQKLFTFVQKCNWLLI